MPGKRGLANDPEIHAYEPYLAHGDTPQNKVLRILGMASVAYI